MTAQVLVPAMPETPIEELLSRDPITLTEADIQAQTRKMVALCRAEIDAYNKDKALTAAQGKKRSGTRTKKKQLTAQQQALAAELQGDGEGGDFDPFA